MFAYFVALLLTLGCATAQLRECKPAQCIIEKLVVGKMEFQLNKMKFEHEDGRMLKEVYVEDKAGSQNVQSTEFEVDEYADEVGYKFLHLTGVHVPSSMFKNEKVPVVFGKSVSMTKQDVIHSYDKENDFFYEQYRHKRIAGKFTCSHSMTEYQKCMVMETRHVFLIPFTATMENSRDRCRCKCNGTFRRHANPSYRYVIDRKDNMQRQFKD